MEPGFPLKMPQRQDADSRRVSYMQALIGEQFGGGLPSQPSAESHYRVTTYYPTGNFNF